MKNLPASNLDVGTSGRVRSRGSQRGVGNGRAGGDVGGQLPNSNIVVEGGGAVAGVDDDAGDTNEDTSAAAVLEGC